MQESHTSRTDALEAYWERAKPQSWNMKKHAKERELLRDLLEEGEVPERIVAGSLFVGDGAVLTGIAVATERRVLFLHKGKREEYKSAQVRYGEMWKVEHEAKFLGHVLAFDGPSIQEHKFKNIHEHSAAESLAAYVLPHVALKYQVLPEEDLPQEEEVPTHPIDEQWNRVKPAHWGAMTNRGEREMLHTLLEAGENIIVLLGGHFGPDLGQAQPGKTLHKGIAVATDRRVLMVDKGVFGSTEVAEMRHQSIESIAYSTGMLFAGLRITGRGTASFRIENVGKPEVKPFVDYVRSQVVAQQTPTVQVESGRSASAVDELEKLAGLLERGHLTQEEFDIKKKQLLAGY